MFGWFVSVPRAFKLPDPLTDSGPSWKHCRKHRGLADAGGLGGGPASPSPGGGAWLAAPSAVAAVSAVGEGAGATSPGVGSAAAFFAPFTGVALAFPAAEGLARTAPGPPLRGCHRGRQGGARPQRTLPCWRQHWAAPSEGKSGWLAKSCWLAHPTPPPVFGERGPRLEMGLDGWPDRSGKIFGISPESSNQRSVESAMTVFMCFCRVAYSQLRAAEQGAELS